MSEHETDYLIIGAGAVGLAFADTMLDEDPDNAPSDGPNMIPLDAMGELVETLMAFDRLSKAHPVQI